MSTSSFDFDVITGPSAPRGPAKPPAPPAAPRREPGQAS
jgi:hypothetical protein